MATPAVTHLYATAADSLLTAMERAEKDIADAKARLLAGDRPSTGLTGRILSQSALNVDSAGERLALLIELMGDLDMSGIEYRDVIGRVKRNHTL